MVLALRGRGVAVPLRHDLCMGFDRCRHRRALRPGECTEFQGGRGNVAALSLLQDELGLAHNEAA